MCEPAVAIDQSPPFFQRLSSFTNPSKPNPGLVPGSLDRATCDDSWCSCSAHAAREISSPDRRSWRGGVVVLIAAIGWLLVAN
ncbi:hypothetical protein CONLIGDRAFT_626721 [Coniochaeta ligniaria NRRL 30616]|uniref:Uncharacterized protein n=1 Tax=Coniochaeta ligniaria NRRL 30616 TaxID=1408157 RepID=A0A1J7K3E3_9PEZI|nr:hypothetical protein CONLIGDRAFT_626721 [Coniochaeta ligniaria NRRL 30616]